ncbi:MAG: hypothetical protein AAGU05_02705 [Anaerolineaceae bacterium]
MAKNVCSYPLSVPLNGTQAAKIHIDNGDGNMFIDSLPGDEALLADGELEYLEHRGTPLHTLSEMNGQTALMLNGKGGQTRIRLPWQACNGATNWRLHLSPAVDVDVTALSGGGNLELDLSEMRLTGLEAETGGGNIDAFLPRAAGTVQISLKSGAGNVNVRLPAGVEARVRATTGLGKVMMDPAFNQVDKFIYQTAGFEQAASKLDIYAGSGAGNVVISAC